MRYWTIAYGKTHSKLFPLKEKWANPKEWALLIQTFKDFFYIHLDAEYSWLTNMKTDAFLMETTYFVTIAIWITLMFNNILTILI